jgi:hypothetical protein
MKRIVQIIFIAITIFIYPKFSYSQPEVTQWCVRQITESEAKYTDVFNTSRTLTKSIKDLLVMFEASNSNQLDSIVLSSSVLALAIQANSLHLITVGRTKKASKGDEWIEFVSSNILNEISTHLINIDDSMNKIILVAPHARQREEARIIRQLTRDFKEKVACRK